MRNVEGVMYHLVPEWMSSRRQVGMVPVFVTDDAPRRLMALVGGGGGIGKGETWE